jgi:hypothetical protein
MHERWTDSICYDDCYLETKDIHIFIYIHPQMTCYAQASSLFIRNQEAFLKAAEHHWPG